MIYYNKVDNSDNDNTAFLMLKISSLIDLLTRIAQITIEYDKADGDSGKLVKKLSKS